jgi:hypothetical protein
MAVWNPFRILIQIFVLQSFSSEVAYHAVRALYPARLVDAERRAQDLSDDQRERTIERLRRERDLMVSTEALERFDVWRAPEER